MIKVLETGKGTAMISTRGLCRVTVQPEGRIVDTVMPADEAAEFVERFNSYHPDRDHWAEAESYPQ